ncbi:MAG: cbb3-type cytochrome c oxidase subunit 3 [Rhodospirillales bacterium]|nr:cbb3-type cytochrome c oxidase subunit 3 [Rhodospirillales bacterium]
MSIEGIYGYIRQLWVVWLVLLFAGLMIWVFLPRNRERFRDCANLPFKDDTEER